MKNTKTVRKEVKSDTVRNPSFTIYTDGSVSELSNQTGERTEYPKGSEDAAFIITRVCGLPLKK